MFFSSICWLIRHLWLDIELIILIILQIGGSGATIIAYLSDDIGSLLCSLPSLSLRLILVLDLLKNKLLISERDIVEHFVIFLVSSSIL